jgi:hypothetical protein
MGNFTYHGLQRSAEKAPRPMGIVFGANLATSSKEVSRKPKGGANPQDGQEQVEAAE